MATQSTKRLNYEHYHVAIICPLEVEMSAVRYMLNEEHGRLPKKDGDSNRYILGQMNGHNVAIAFLPQGSQGIGAAATVATGMKRTFPSISLRLLVGIGGGIPSKKHDIRLGDVVVSMPEGTHGGVVQYDLGKAKTDGFERKGFLCPPPVEWRTAVVEMQSDHRIKSRIPEFLSEMLKTYPSLQQYSRPPPEKDLLFSSEVDHVPGETCDKCNRGGLLPQRELAGPHIFYGTIASGNRVIKDAGIRDWISQNAGGALCFEMEAAGLSNDFPCIVIRGICDYSDSHKNDDWHSYGAAVAAACAKELLTYMDPAIGPDSNQGLKEATLSEAEKTTLQTFRNSKYESYKNRNAEAVNETCQWALENNTYNKWFSRRFNDLLWVTADPGCGKSVFSKHLVDKEFTSKGWLAGYFFFRRDGGAIQSSVTSALCAVIHQLASKHHKLVSHIRPKLDADGKKLLENFHKLWEILMLFAQDDNPQNIVIVLDGVDECDGDENYKNLLRALEEYQDKSQSESQSRNVFKFLITSRPYVSLERKLRGIEKKSPGTWLRGDTNLIQSDIDTVVEIKVRELAANLGLDEEAHELVLNSLKGVQNRTYLWVTLTVDELQTTARKSKKKLLERIRNLPKTVEEAYEDMLARVTNREEARTIFRLVLVAERPLSVTEADFAFAMQEAPKRHDELDCEGDSSFEEFIKLVCGLFISVFDRHLYFLHETAREFLTSEDVHQPGNRSSTPSEAWKHSLNITETHLWMADLCSSYLLLEEFHSDPLTVKLSDEYRFPQVKEPTYFPYEAVDYVCGEMAKLYTQGAYLESSANTSSHADGSLYHKVFPEKDPPDQHTKSAEATIDVGSETAFESPNIIQRRIALDRAQKATRSHLARFPFLEYSATRWHFHVARLPDIDQPLRSKLLKLYDETRPAFSNWFSVYWAKEPVSAVPHFKPLSICLMFRHHHSIVRSLVESGADINYYDIDRKPIHIAAQQGLRDDLQFLLDHGANIDDTNCFNRTAIHLACYYHRKDVVELLLKRSANVNARDKFGYNCVHILAQRFNEPIFRLLVAHGIDLRQKDRPGRTPLWLGLYDDRADFIGALIQAGVVPTGSDLNRAVVESAHKSMTHLQAGIDLESKRREAVCEPPVRMVPNDDMEAFLDTLEKGPSLFSRDWVENTILHEACERNALSILKFCLEKGLDPNVTNVGKITPLHLAAKRSSHDAIALLLAAGADVNAKEAGGGTALHSVSKNGDEIGAAMLLDQGAILESRNSIEQTPLICASILRQFDMVNFLIAKGADVKAEDATGGSVPFVPVMMGMTDLVRELLERGANPNVRSLETDYTLLEVAIVSEKLEVAKLLLEKGADIDSKGEKGKRPIHRAISGRNREIVEWLVAQGADIHTLDDGGLTVLHWVAFGTKSEDGVEIARLFIEKGVDGTVKDSVRGKTALEYAQQDEEDDCGMVALLASAFPPPEEEEEATD